MLTSQLMGRRTDRQTDRWTNRRTDVDKRDWDIQTNQLIGWQTKDRQEDREMDRQIDLDYILKSIDCRTERQNECYGICTQINQQTYKHTDRNMRMQTHQLTDWQTDLEYVDISTDERTNRQTDRQQYGLSAALLKNYDNVFCDQGQGLAFELHLI
jgi:hypothetical protein